MSKIQVIDDYHISCPSCGLHFINPLANIFGNALISGSNNKAVCPRCKFKIAMDDLKSVRHGDEIFTIPSTSRLTLRNGDQREVSKELYFCASKKGHACSSIWKVWSQKEDVYLVNSEANFLKFSFHKTGQDLLQINRESFDNYGRGLETRKLMGWWRPKLYPAHLNCVLHIDIKSTSKPREYIEEKLNNRKRSRLKKIEMSGDILQLTIAYCRGHPDKFLETSIPDSNLIGIIRGSREDFFIIYRPEPETPEERRSRHLLYASIQRACIPSYIVDVIAFGMTDRRSFFVYEGPVNFKFLNRSGIHIFPIY